jgi:hypothetical protein
MLFCTSPEVVLTINCVSCDQYMILDRVLAELRAVRQLAYIIFAE